MHIMCIQDNCTLSFSFNFNYYIYRSGHSIFFTNIKFQTVSFITREEDLHTLEPVVKLQVDVIVHTGQLNPAMSESMIRLKLIRKCKSSKNIPKKWRKCKRLLKREITPDQQLKENPRWNLDPTHYSGRRNVLTM